MASARCCGPALLRCGWMWAASAPAVRQLWDGSLLSAPVLHGMPRGAPVDRGLREGVHLYLHRYPSESLQGMARAGSLRGGDGRVARGGPDDGKSRRLSGRRGAHRNAGRSAVRIEQCLDWRRDGWQWRTYERSSGETCEGPGAVASDPRLSDAIPSCRARPGSCRWCPEGTR